MARAHFVLQAEGVKAGFEVKAIAIWYWRMVKVDPWTGEHVERGSLSKEIGVCRGNAGLKFCPLQTVFGVRHMTQKGI